MFNIIALTVNKHTSVLTHNALSVGIRIAKENNER